MTVNKQKSVSPIVTAVLFFIISAVLVYLILGFGIPYLERLGTLKAVDESKTAILEINSVMDKMRKQELTVTELSVRITNGKMIVDSDSDKIYFQLTDIQNALPDDFQDNQGNIQVIKQGAIRIQYLSSDLNIVTTDSRLIELGQGLHVLHFSFEGVQNNQTKVKVSVN